MTMFERNPELEFSSPAEIRTAQEKLLKKHLQYLSLSSPYYAKLFREQVGRFISVLLIASGLSLPWTAL